MSELIAGAEVRQEIGAEYHVVQWSSTIRLWAALTFSPLRVRYRWCCDACPYSGLEVATYGEAESAAAAHVCGDPVLVDHDRLF